MDRELSGKIAFVTGSGRGLGQVMAERLAELGADVAIHDLDWDAAGEIRRGARPRRRSAKQIGAARHARRPPSPAISATRRRSPKMKDDDRGRSSAPVDILVNCAGGDIGAAGGKPVPEQRARHPARGHPGADQQQPDRHHAGLPGLRAADGRERGRGSVINIASAAAHIGVLARRGLLDAEGRRRPLHALPRPGADRPDGVRVNAVSPGPTKTARFQATRAVDPAKMDSRRSRSTATPSRPRSPTPSPSSPARAAASSTARCCASTAA